MAALHASFVPFTAQHAHERVDLASARSARAADTLRKYVEALGQRYPAEVARSVDDMARRGSTPLVVADQGRVMGVVELKDIVKGGIRNALCRTAPHGHQDRHDHRRQPLTAAAIAAEAGVDDFLAEATPEDKLG
jgi:K+-transporting ATPase ATPase B chain